MREVRAMKEFGPSSIPNLRSSAKSHGFLHTQIPSSLNSSLDDSGSHWFENKVSLCGRLFVQFRVYVQIWGENQFAFDPGDPTTKSFQLSRNQKYWLMIPRDLGMIEVVLDVLKAVWWMFSIETMSIRVKNLGMGRLDSWIRVGLEVEGSPSLQGLCYLSLSVQGLLSLFPFLQVLVRMGILCVRLSLSFIYVLTSWLLFLMERAFLSHAKSSIVRNLSVLRPKFQVVNEQFDMSSKAEEADDMIETHFLSDLAEEAIDDDNSEKIDIDVQQADDAYARYVQKLSMVEKEFKFLEDTCLIGTVSRGKVEVMELKQNLIFCCVMWLVMLVGSVLSLLYAPVIMIGM